MVRIFTGIFALSLVLAVSAAQTIYLVKGYVKELPADGKTVVIQHEAIPGYMAAMTMPFDVRDTNELRGLKVGDAISFHMNVTPKEGWVSDITKLNKPPLPAPSPPSTMKVATAVELDEGDMLPDYHFTNELGKAVSLGEYKGQVIAFTFFFTSCPFPNFCPRITSDFAETEKKLLQMPNAPARWHLFSISFDPQTDTPRHLLTYARNAGYDPAHWSFLTGSPGEISALADQFGEMFWREGGTMGHNIRTVVVDAQGRIRKIFPGNEWTSDQLAQAMVN